jgi:hypothetical protein
LVNLDDEDVENEVTWTISQFLEDGNPEIEMIIHGHEYAIDWILQRLKFENYSY